MSQEDGSSDRAINVWKIVALTLLTWLGFSVLAKLYMIYVMLPRHPTYTMLDSQCVVWMWMCLFMGIYLAVKLRKWTEGLWGLLFFILCLLPLVGMLFGVGYFAWAYVKWERARIGLIRS